MGSPHSRQSEAERWRRNLHTGETDTLPCSSHSPWRPNARSSARSHTRLRGRRLPSGGAGSRGAGGAGGRRRGEGLRALTVNNNNGNLGRPAARLAPHQAGPWGFPLARPGLPGSAGRSGGVPAGNRSRSARPPRRPPPPPPGSLGRVVGLRRPAGEGRRAAPAGGGLERASASPSVWAGPRADGGGGGVAEEVPGVTGRLGEGAESPRLPPASSRDHCGAGAGLFRAASPRRAAGESGAHHRQTQPGGDFCGPPPPTETEKARPPRKGGLGYSSPE